LEILFKNQRLQKECNSLGRDQPGKILRRRLDDLRAAATLAAMKNLPGHCHELKGDLEGLLSVRLVGGNRLVFSPAHNPPPTKQDGGLDWSNVTAITIEDIGDYHD
jgi:proteic killer suppression protein